MKSSKLLHILIIQQAPDWGGAEEWIATLVDHWTQTGHRITAYTNLSQLVNRWQASGAATHHLPFILDIIGNLKGLIKAFLLFPFAVIYYLSVLFQAQKDGVDVIVMSGFSEKLLVSWLSVFFHLPVVWFEYGPLETVFARHFGLPRLLYNLSTNIPQTILTISKHTKRQLLACTSIKPESLSVIYPGVPIPHQRPSLTSKPVVGCLSRVASEKGQRLLVKIWPQVIKAVPKAQLLIAGSGPDLTYLKSLVKSLNISASVKFLGFIDDKARFYRQLSLFVFPSLWDMEGFGLVAAEALSFGLPVVATATGPIPEIITPAVGITVNPSNPNLLTEAVITLLKNPSHCQKLSTAAYCRASQQFTAATQAHQVLSVIQKSISA